jgi:hypothetical protein
MERNANKKEFQANKPEPAEGIFRNRLSFYYPGKRVKLWVSKEPKESYRRFHYRKLPLSIHKSVEGLGDGNIFVWISLLEGAGDKEIELELRYHPAVAEYWFSERSYQYLKEKVRITGSTFTRDRQYWHEEKSLHKKGLLAFSRFSIRFRTVYNSEKADMTVIYEGVSYVITKSAEKLAAINGIDTHLLKKVIYKKQVYKYQGLGDGIRYHLDEIYPVLNRELARSMGLGANVRPEKYKLTKAYQEIAGFYHNYLEDERFRKIVPHGGRWEMVDKKDIFYLKKRSHELLFGGNHRHNDIFKGIKEYGAAGLISKRHIKWFLIYREQERERARILEDFVAGNKGLIRLSTLLGSVPVHDSGLDIRISGGSDITEELRGRIIRMKMETDTSYFAFYLSPVQKRDPRPREHELYYKVKEILLGRGIMSQAIDSNNVRESLLAYSMTNIGIAMNAKLGGTPWRLADKKRKELIIGFGAYRSQKRGWSYVGSAFCFDNGGMFQEFDCWPANEGWALDAKLADALRRYRDRNSGIERLVIHYYKEMRHKDLKKIEDRLDDIDSRIPVIVIRFNSSFDKRELVFDAGNSKYLAENGCYVRLRPHQYLLHINSKEAGGEIKDAPLPLKLSLQSNRAGLLDDEELAEELLRQVYDFSILHWRSVKQPRLPVTVAYPRIVAEIFPWFDADVLPDAARDSLWFL